MMQLNSSTCERSPPPPPGVDESWKQTFYLPLPDAVHHAVGVVLVILFGIGVVTNGTALYAFISSSALRTPQNMFLFNLSVVDTIMMLSCQPYFAISSFFRDAQFNCEVMGPFLTFGGIGSIVSLTAIAYDRYAMICFPAEAPYFRSRKRSLAIISLVWTYSIGIALLPMAGIGQFIPSGLKDSCTFDFFTQSLSNRTHMIILYFGGFLGPLLFSTFCYLSIYRYVQVRGVILRENEQRLSCKFRRQQTGDSVGEQSGERSQKSSQPYQNTNGTNGSPRVSVVSKISVATRLLLEQLLTKAKIEQRMVKVSLVCFVVFLVSWLPWAVVGAVGHFGEAALITPYVTVVPIIMAKANCIVNPIVYTLALPQYRDVLLKKFRGMRQSSV